MMYSFHVTIHARPPHVGQGPSLELAGLNLPALAIEPAELAATPMRLTFEAALAALAQLERMYCEPDGSFVWTSAQGESTWQIDGNLYDREGRLSFVDIKGTCPPERFDQLLTALGHPASGLIFQLTREAVFLDEAQFRRHAERVATG